MSAPPAVRVGVIADTHGLLRPEAVDALRGVDLVLHAGDVGGPEVLDGLRALAPVVAVRGNNDRGPWAAGLPARADVELAGVRIHVLHDLAELALDPAREGIGLVVAGHSHRPRLERREGVAYLNPGSAGPRRFALPVSVARLRLEAGRADAEIVELAVAPPTPRAAPARRGPRRHPA